MIAFEVKDMSCGHCVATITQAIQRVDPQAKVQIDLSQHRVSVEPANSDESGLRDVISEAGFTPVLVPAVR